MEHTVCLHHWNGHVQWFISVDTSSIANITIWNGAFNFVYHKEFFVFFNIISPYQSSIGLEVNSTVTYGLNSKHLWIKKQPLEPWPCMQSDRIFLNLLMILLVKVHAKAALLLSKWASLFNVWIKLRRVCIKRQPSAPGESVLSHWFCYHVIVHIKAVLFFWSALEVYVE